MTLYWLQTGMFGGHSPHNHDPSLETAATSLYSSGKKEASYRDCCFAGTIRVEDTEACIGGISGFVFGVTPTDEAIEQGFRPARFLIAHRDLRDNAYIN